MKLRLHERLVLRVYGVKISRDGTRITIPRKHADVLDGVVAKARAAAWREDKPGLVTQTADGVQIVGPKATVEVRIV